MDGYAKRRDHSILLTSKLAYRISLKRDTRRKRSNTHLDVPAQEPSSRCRIQPRAWSIGAANRRADKHSGNGHNEQCNS